MNFVEISRAAFLQNTFKYPLLYVHPTGGNSLLVPQERDSEIGRFFKLSHPAARGIHKPIFG